MTYEQCRLAFVQHYGWEPALNVSPVVFALRRQMITKVEAMGLLDVVARREAVKAKLAAEQEPMCSRCEKPGSECDCEPAGVFL